MLTRRQRLQAGAIAAAVSPLVAGLGRTWRFRVSGAEHYEAIVASGRQPIIAFWHGRILPGLFFFRGRGIVVITSRNFDGEWIARILHRFGFGTARGSSSRGGASALVQLRRDLASGRPVAFTLDGPRGPYRVAQPGAVWLAGATGHPILPLHLEAARHWTLGSWDRTQIPRPFSEVAVAMGEPIPIDGTDPGTLSSRTAALEVALAELERRALGLLGSAAALPEAG